MISQDLLKEATKLIGGDRQTDYGDKLKNHQNIADFWSVFLKKKITAHDVAICMALVKVARLMNQHKKDSYLDMAAYAAIAGEIEARTNKKNHSFEAEGERRGRKTSEAIAEWHEERKK
jgi:hypothetical protein|tara:strand:- start:2294 stop:2650 length:357 start_codon:yes stop_codon:yes gene_type:complete